MTSEFDKEIDTLLRQTAKGEAAFAAENAKSTIENPQLSHLDADEISAFAENALPEKTKQRYTMHLADCSRCRSILSNLISLNAETETEVIMAEKTEKVRAVIPWYRKLFAYPDLTYSLGGLLLAFTGLIAYVVLQNNNASPGLEISQISEQTEKAQGPSFNKVLPAGESFSNSMMSNSTMSNASPNVSTTNSASISAENKTTNAVAANTNMSIAAKPKPSANESSRAEISANNFALSPNKSNLQPENANTNVAPKEKVETRKEENQIKKSEVLEDADAAKPAPKSYDAELPISGRTANAEALTALRKKTARETSETNSVGGKSFKRANGIWTDSSYTGQSTTNVSRGTKEYKKLDSGLRSIVDNLGGIVILVWKEKAYRIQ